MFKVESRNTFSDVKASIRKYLNLKKKRSYMKRTLPRVQNYLGLYLILSFVTI